MTVVEYFKITFKKGENHQSRNAIVCNDGFSVSAQGSSFHYCSPRITDDSYTAIELGFPSQEDELINSFAEDNSQYTETVYGWVDMEIVEKLIDKHGGINITKTFKL